MIRNNSTDSTPIVPVAGPQPIHRWERAGGAADDDVLRRRPLKPHGVDCNVKEDREGKERGGKPIRNKAQHRNRADCERHAERERLPRQDPTGRYRPPRGPPHHRIDIGVVPHIEGAGGAGPDRDAQERGEAKHRVEMPRRHHQADQCGEHTSDITRGFINAM